MPQLDLTPWFIILVCTWFCLFIMIYLMSKLSVLIMPMKHTTRHLPNYWLWTWL